MGPDWAQHSPQPMFERSNPELFDPGTPHTACQGHRLCHLNASSPPMPFPLFLILQWSVKCVGKESEHLGTKSQVRTMCPHGSCQEPGAQRGCTTLPCGTAVATTPPSLLPGNSQALADQPCSDTEICSFPCPAPCCFFPSGAWRRAGGAAFSSACSILSSTAICLPCAAPFLVFSEAA